jgi:polyvinyl alcohol dehydrogenase (cytochrome)
MLNFDLLRGCASRTLALCIVLAGSSGCDNDSDHKPSAEPKDHAKHPDAGSPDSASSATWSSMGYDARNNYFNPHEHKLSVATAPALKELWRFEVAGFPTGAPAIAEGKVFVTATGGTYGVDFKTGAMIWERSDISGTASPAYEDGAVYVHTADANLYRLKASDGTTDWGPIHSYELSTCDGTSSPILADGKVLVGHSCGATEVGANNDEQAVARGGVEAFSTTDGSRLWTYYTVPESGENGAMVWSSVAVDAEAGLVFAGTGNNYTLGGEHSDAIHAIDLATGERKWVHQVRSGDTWSYGSNAMANGPDDDFGANPIVADVGGTKIVADGDKGAAFWALDREDGSLLWSRPDLTKSRTAANGGVLNNGGFDGKHFVFVSNEPPDSALLYAVDPLTGEDAWPPQRIETVVWGAPSMANGLLVVPADTVLNIYAAESGELINTFETGGSIAGAPAIADGKIVVKSGLQYIYASYAKVNNLVICYGL